MGIAFHIFKKDLRRLWPFLIVLLTYAALQSILLVADRQSASLSALDWTSRLRSSDLAGTGGLWILTALIIVFLIHEDPPSGKSAFWLTRPIPLASLMAAKAGFIFFFLVAVPAAANLSVLFMYGLEPVRMAPAPMNGIGIQLIFIGFMVAFGVVTSSLQAFLLALVSAAFLLPQVVKYIRDFEKEELDLVRKTEKIMEKKHGFLVRDHNIEFLGLCEQCRPGGQKFLAKRAGR
jgi:hypothetical protein